MHDGGEGAYSSIGFDVTSYCSRMEGVRSFRCLAISQWTGLVVVIERIAYLKSMVL
jgi:hypothetical protein